MYQACDHNQREGKAIMMRTSGLSYPVINSRQRANENQNQERKRSDAQDSHIFRQRKITAAMLPVGAFRRVNGRCVEDRTTIPEFTRPEATADPRMPSYDGKRLSPRGKARAE